MAPRETENNAYAKFLGDKQRALWYVMVFSGVVNCHFNVFPQVFHYFSARNSFLLCCVLTTSISVLPGRKKSLYRFLRTTLL